MILSEEGIRKIIREAFKIRKPEGPEFRSSDDRYRCKLESLKKSTNNSVVGKIIFFLNRALYYNPTGLSKKSFLEKLDRFLSTGMTMTPDENLQYNTAIRKFMSNSSDKEAIINKIEKTLDIMFFPSAAPVCRIVDAYFENLGGYEDKNTDRQLPGAFDLASFFKAIEISSEKMLNQLRISQNASYQILFPKTYHLIAKGKEKEEINEEFIKEKEYFKNNVIRQRSQNVNELYREIKKIHLGVGQRKNKKYYLDEIERYFQKLENDGYSKNVPVANAIKDKIIDLINSEPLSI